MSIDNERRQLVNTNRALLQEVEELSAMVDTQGTRIAELEGTVVVKLAWTEALVMRFRALELDLLG